MNAAAAGTRRLDRSVAVTLLLLIGWEASGGDIAVVRGFAGPAGFALRDAWLTSTLLHDGGRWLAGAVMLLWALVLARPGASRPSRAEHVYWGGVTIACLLLVPGLKRLSESSCPWEIAGFGGQFAYVPHWLPGVTDGGPGHCFPSGHAVAAFAFFGLYFLWRPYRPALARWMLAGVVVAGAAFGWAQIARGAHFPSHVLWSGWLCWAAAVAAQGLRPSAGRRAVQARVGPRRSSAHSSTAPNVAVPIPPSLKPPSSSV